MCLVQYRKSLKGSIWPELQKKADCTDRIAFSMSGVTEAQKTIKFHISRGKTHYDALEKVCNS